MRKYDNYKDSFIEWVGKIPEHWEVKRLKYVAEANPSNIDKKSQDGERDVLLCNYMDVYKNNFITNEITFMQATASEVQIQKFSLQKGDVIATKDSESSDDIGIAALVKENLDNVVCGYHLTHIKPKRITGEYLFRQFQSEFVKSNFAVAANGITRYALGVDDFNSLMILVPPISEQTIIAGYLDRKTTEIDALVADKMHLLELYEAEKTAIINQAVTKGIDPNVRMKDTGIEWLGKIPEHWELSRMKNICSVRQGLQIPIEDRLLVQEDNSLEYITIRSINNPETPKEYIKNPSSNVVCTKDDILMARTGATGEPIINVEGVFHNNFFLVDYDRTQVDRMFLYYFLKSSRIKEYLLLVAGTTTIPDLNHGAFYNTPFFKFEIKEQQSIVHEIESACRKIDKKIAQTQKLIDLLIEYRTALITEVVTGKVKISD